MRLNLSKIKKLVEADLKRDRSTYDSYQLVMERRNASSKAWVYEDVMNMKRENPLDYPTIKVHGILRKAKSVRP